jgi:carbamoyl-phosphate synthase/aspartate carbamoyltransferase
MENLDPLGVHTGESIVVAPAQTLNDLDHNRLRDSAIKTISSLGIIGECNIQFAVNPDKSDDFFIIEVNARLSRSSALASKATGYPLAYVAAKLTLGIPLDELKNKLTETTSAFFEPAMDYCVVKIPRWDLIKFERVDTHIGSAMKSVGEGMAISRTFEEALQSAIRMTGLDEYGLRANVVGYSDDEMRNPSYRRVLSIATGLANGVSIDHINKLSGIDKWFLYRIDKIVKLQCALGAGGGTTTPTPTPNRYWQLAEAKKLGFSDKFIAKLLSSTELAIRSYRISMGIKPLVKRIDTVAGEFPCRTNYMYVKIMFYACTCKTRLTISLGT